jgi:hypothetical protein
MATAPDYPTIYNPLRNQLDFFIEGISDSYQTDKGTKIPSFIIKWLMNNPVNSNQAEREQLMKYVEWKLKQ